MTRSDAIHHAHIRLSRFAHDRRFRARVIGAAIALGASYLALREFRPVAVAPLTISAGALAFAWALSARRTVVVYSLSSDWRPAPSPHAASVRPITADDIEQSFSAAPILRLELKHLLRHGHYGVAAFEGTNALAWAWMSTPGSHPPHLPVQVARENAFWVFGCRTLPAFRNRGLYGACLQSLCIHARQHNRPVFIDCYPDNAPSRRAILRTGFRENGLLQYRVAPMLRPALLTWRRDIPHPPLPQRDASDVNTGAGENEKARGGFP